MSNSNNKYKTLVSNTMLISLGTFGSKLLVFFMVRFYTSYLTPADYGTADLITQTANLLFPLISLGITDGVFRFAVDHTEQRRNIFSVGVYTILAGAVLLVAILPLLGLFLLMPPVITLFVTDGVVAGVPLIVVYMFATWLGLVVAAALLARRLRPPEARDDASPPDDAPGESG